VTAVSAVDQTARHTSAEYLDRFHSVAGMNKTPGEVCTAQARQLIRDGYEPLLKLPALYCQVERMSSAARKVGEEGWSRNGSDVT